jgi:ADP-ribose pyrophosphatase YjhB (NUDIX family)
MTREYPARPIVGIGIAVLQPDAVLLVRRGKPPNAGSWSLPGGAQELGETAEAAARRELREEAGIDVGDLHLAATVDSIHPDPDGRIRYHYTIIDFCAAYAGGEPIAGGDVTEVAWAGFGALDRFDLWSEASRVIALARRALGLDEAPPLSSACAASAARHGGS